MKKCMKKNYRSDICQTWRMRKVDFKDVILLVLKLCE